MFTAQNFEKATEYEGLLGSAHSSDEASELRELLRRSCRKHGLADDQSRQVDPAAEKTPRGILGRP